MKSKEKIKYNLVLGVLSEILTIVLGILVPRLILTSYGSEINGLLNSVTQIYSYIALLEAGIGTATVQALYKAIAAASNDQKNSILAATNKYYHKTGILYFVAIIVFSVIYPLAVDTDIPIITIVLVIIFNGLGSVINYFFQAKYFLLLQAEGKNYIKTSLTMFTNIFKNVMKILLMYFGFDVVFVQAIAMLVSLIQMVYIIWYIKKYYKWIDLNVKPDFESISQSKNVLVHQISGLVFSNTDNIVLTVFCGLKAVSVYSMYNLFFSMINTAQVTVSGSIVFLLGQTYHTDKKKFMKLYDIYEVYYMALTFMLYSVTLYFILPFMKIFTSGVTDVEYLDKWLPYLFTFSSLLSCARNAPNNAISFAGHFKQTQNRSILEAIINLTVSLVCVNYFGIYGVLFGTIVALLYRTNDIIVYASKNVLKRTPLITYKRWAVDLFIFAVVQYINRFVCLDMDSYVKIIAYAIPYTIVSFVIYFGIASLFDLKVSKDAIYLLIGMIRRKKA